MQSAQRTVARKQNQLEWIHLTGSSRLLLLPSGYLYLIMMFPFQRWLNNTVSLSMRQPGRSTRLHAQMVSPIQARPTGKAYSQRINPGIRFREIMTR